MVRLKENDVIVFESPGKKLSYLVQSNHCQNITSLYNNEILEYLEIPKEQASIAYGYDYVTGDWPEYKEGDYRALERFMKIIVEKARKVGFTVIVNGRTITEDDFKYPHHEDISFLYRKEAHAYIDSNLDIFKDFSVGGIDQSNIEDFKKLLHQYGIPYPINWGGKHSHGTAYGLIEGEPACQDIECFAGKKIHFSNPESLKYFLDHYVGCDFSIPEEGGESPYIERIPVEIDITGKLIECSRKSLSIEESAPYRGKAIHVNKRTLIEQHPTRLGRPIKYV